MPRINAKTAAEAAAKYLQETVGLRGTQVYVEEIEHIDGDEEWAVTLGFYQEAAPSNFGVVMYGEKKEKEYKIFRVDSETGEVLSMKIRTLG